MSYFFKELDVKITASEFWERALRGLGGAEGG